MTSPAVKRNLLFGIVMATGVMLVYWTGGYDAFIHVRANFSAQPQSSMRAEAPPDREKCTLEERRLAFRQLCQIVKHPESHASINRNLAFNIGYCHMAKAGGSTMRNVFGQMEKYTKTAHLSVSKHNSSKLTNLLVVRHPLSRLRSLYDNKLNKRYATHNKMGLGKNVQLIDEYFREANIPRNSSFDPKSEFLTFEQFLDILTKKYDKGFHDAHWTPLTPHCNLCHVDYNTILKLETFEEDTKILENMLHTIHPEANITIPHLNACDNNLNVTSAEKDSNDNQLFASLNSTLVRRVLKVYENDMRILGYQWSEEGGLTCGYSRPDGTTCC